MATLGESWRWYTPPVPCLIFHFPRNPMSFNQSSNSWRLPLLGGLVIGGFLSAILGGGWDPTWDLGVFDQEIGWNAGGKVAWMFVGGVLIGFGTRLGGGCTSGHGIFGLSNLELPSVVTTIAFMIGGIVTTNLIYRVIV